jgi:hypothetical protein
VQREIWAWSQNSYKLHLKLSVHTSNKTQRVSVSKASGWSMPFREIMVIYSKNQTKSANILCGKNSKSVIVKESGTHSYRRILKWYNSAILSCWWLSLKTKTAYASKYSTKKNFSTLHQLVPNSIWWRAQIMMLLIAQFCVASCCFSVCSPRLHLPKHPKSMFFPCNYTVGTALNGPWWMQSHEKEWIQTDLQVQ